MLETIAIDRTFDAARMNALANDPSIRPFVGGDGASFIDLTLAVSLPQNVFLNGEHGGFAFSWTAPRCFEVHTFILPSGRGSWSRSFARAARDWMEAHGALHLWTRVPAGHENIRRFTLDAGFVEAGLDIVNGIDYDLYDWRPSCP